MKLRFLPQSFRFVYENGNTYEFTGSPACCMDEYKNSKRKIVAVYQKAAERFVKISD